MITISLVDLEDFKDEVERMQGATHGAAVRIASYAEGPPNPMTNERLRVIEAGVILGGELYRLTLLGKDAAVNAEQRAKLTEVCEELQLEVLPGRYVLPGEE